MRYEIKALLNERSIRTLRSLLGEWLESVRVKADLSPSPSAGGQILWAYGVTLLLENHTEIVLLNREFHVKEEGTEHPSLHILPVTELLERERKYCFENNFPLEDALPVSFSPATIRRITVFRDTITTNPWVDEEVARGEEFIREHIVDLAVRFHLDDGKELLVFCHDSIM